MRSDLVSIRWQLYGVILRRREDNLGKEPLTNLIPSEGIEFRIMRPLRGDRVSDGVPIRCIWIFLSLSHYRLS